MFQQKVITKDSGKLLKRVRYAFGIFVYFTGVLICRFEFDSDSIVETIKNRIQLEVPEETGFKLLKTDQLPVSYELEPTPPSEAIGNNNQLFIILFCKLKCFYQQKRKNNN